MPTFGIIGLGKAGTALARALQTAPALLGSGSTLAAVSSRDPHKAARFPQARAESPGGVLARVDVTLLTVPDDAIARLAGQLAASGGELAGKAVIHTSGTHGTSALAPLAARGAMVGSLHPAFPFTEGIDLPEGVTFAVEASDVVLRGWLLELVTAFRGHALSIPPGSKAQYHAALSIASNYAVTLYALAEHLLLGLGAEQAAADAALNTLVRATADNLARVGVPAALTGPLVRGDVGTVRAHLMVLKQTDSGIHETYRMLARLTLPLVRARGVDTSALEQLLESGEAG